jgi:hypothetical protein
LAKLIQSRYYLALEFLVLCIVVPTYIIITKSAPFMFSFLWGATLYCYLILRICFHENLKHIWNWAEVNWKNFKHILVRWVLATLGMVAFIYVYDPERLFFLVRERPGFLPFLMVLYPILSALPQELIFCSFFFVRYEPYFGKSYKMVLASAILFAYAHILYLNPVAPVLSLLGGVIFAQTYLKTKSLALVTIEHGLYGNSLFIVGLGWYFYSGAVVTS